MSTNETTDGCNTGRRSREASPKRAANSAPHGEASAKCGHELWREYLLSHSSKWAELFTEMQRGWNSPAVEALWKKRTAHLESRKKENHGYSEDQQRGMMEEYRDWARNSLPEIAPEVFGWEREGSFRFLDIGCAPGGLSAFLHGDLGWKGVGVTLSPSEGGMPMCYTAKGYSLVLANILADSFADNVQEEVVKESVDFANAGAVMDRSLRGGDHEQSTTFTVEDIDRLLVFPKRQLVQCFRALKPGGSIMFVYGPSQCGMLFLLLSYMLPMVKGRTRVIRTMHAGRTPVYILMNDVRPTREGIHELQQLFSHVDRFTLEDSADRERAAAVFQKLKPEFESIWGARAEMLKESNNRAEAGSSETSAPVFGRLSKGSPPTNGSGVKRDRGRVYKAPGGKRHGN